MVELENQPETAFQNAIMLAFPSLFAGFTIAYLYGKWAAVRHAWPMVLIIATIHGGGQLALMLWDPILSTFLASAVALLALYPLSRWGHYSEPAEEITERPAMQEESPEEAEREREEHEEEEPEPVMGLWMALMPYIVLTALTVAAIVPPPVEETLEQFEVGLPFPQTETGFGVENAADDQYEPFAPLTHPGTFLLLAAVVGYVVYRFRGYYRAWEERAEPEGLWPGLVGNATLASIAIVAFLIMSKLMDNSGQTNVLALGIAEVAPSPVFAFFSGWIALLGAFMTSSNAASNILFAPLLEEAGGAVAGTYLVGGEAPEEIAGLVERLDADLLVVDRQEPTPVRRLANRSISEEMSRLVRCPVLMAKGGKGRGPISHRGGRRRGGAGTAARRRRQPWTGGARASQGRQRLHPGHARRGCPGPGLPPMRGLRQTSRGRRSDVTSATAVRSRPSPGCGRTCIRR